WQATSDRTSRLKGGLAGEPGSLLLDQDGRPAGLVRIEDGGVAFELSSGPSWFASLSSDAVARLSASLQSARR
ncbi:MAG: hypothetical protein M3Y55_11120, partial [Pseudomonadota bacterium]|nr:hypothetical protein [Pseudomonadota bacterium]